MNSKQMIVIAGTVVTLFTPRGGSAQQIMLPNPCTGHTVMIGSFGARGYAICETLNSQMEVESIEVYSITGRSSAIAFTTQLQGSATPVRYYFDDETAYQYIWVNSGEKSLVFIQCLSQRSCAMGQTFAIEFANNKQVAAHECILGQSLNDSETPGESSSCVFSFAYSAQNDSESGLPLQSMNSRIFSLEESVPGHIASAAAMLLATH